MWLPTDLPSGYRHELNAKANAAVACQIQRGGLATARMLLGVGGAGGARCSSTCSLQGTGTGTAVSSAQMGWEEGSDWSAGLQTPGKKSYSAFSCHL